MEKASLFLNKWVAIAIYALLIITCINSCNSCSMNKENIKLRKEVDSLSVSIKMMDLKTYDKKELDVRLTILALEQEKSTLFNVNYIVLTKERPDKRMNEIDAEIRKLQEKLTK